MTNRGRRLWLLLGASVATLAAAVTPALAAIAPTLSATTEATATSIAYQQGASDDPASSIVLYVPAGYAALLAQSEGEVVGKVKGTAVVADAGGSTVQLAGDITVALGTTTVNAAALSATAIACTGTATHSAFWILNLAGGGQTFQVPAYIDDVSLTDPRSSFTNTTVRICLGPPDVPAGTAGRAPAGAKFTGISLSLTDVLSVAPGWYLWHVVTTPYSPGTGKANPAGAATSQSFDRIAQEVTLNARAGKGGAVIVTGRTTAGSKGVSGVAVSILSGTTEIGKATTRPGGYYKVSVTVPDGADTLTAAAVAPVGKATCQQGFFAGIACGNATFAGWSAVSQPTPVP